MRHDEAERAHEVRGDPHQYLALGQGLADQPERVLLKIAQPAMHELRGGRRGRTGEIALLGERDAQAAAGGVARDAGAVDAAADDEEIDLILWRKLGHRIPNAI